MSTTSFGKILTVLDLFSVSRPVINVDLICHELGLSKPTSYRYLKELVTTGLLQRICGTSGDYMLGPKIAVLDYISRATDPLVQMSIPLMKEIAELTELDCMLTFLNHDYCIDLHSESFQKHKLLSYGRGNPRSVYMGSSPKVMVSHLNKKSLHVFYTKYANQLQKTDFAHNEDTFMQRMKKIKKQGYYFSQGEVIENYAGLAVPVHYSKKLPPLALTIIGSKNRFTFVDLNKLIMMLKDSAGKIEQQYFELIHDSELIS
ncbi:helix-turn-helix domain-containing protein [Acinetobacter sp. B5B]|uniref:IclR family transcriptional regulator n=1 Tax=Acinetobacter baretiae TaxID=2605383 RepID=UPI0018C301F4|nr:IclR family transcriptional regulator C-terminal domain-containing protein [Acinetobacter baretiae]MBF7682788.1 helix-turn-helix domain-containing protein [Acinetobacter baretiae]MBF7686308.1 helix-turn-helix domain-containing protein [Acinetobacter baretiae]